MSDQGVTPMARASFSRLQYYQNCPKAYELKYVHKIEELERPIQLNKDGTPKPHANERGSTIHEAMDDYINGRRDDLAFELLDIASEVEEARAIKQRNPDRVITEQQWFFDPMWNEIQPEEVDKFPKDYQVIIIIDCLIISEDGKSARVIDLKSGKRYRNEAKHAKQTQLYAVATAEKFPDLEQITTELWYCDIGLVHTKPYTRMQALAFQRYWEQNIEQMQEDTLYEAKPNPNSCRFCAYGPADHSNKWVNKTGHCTEGVA